MYFNNILSLFLKDFLINIKKYFYSGEYQKICWNYLGLGSDITYNVTAGLANS